VPEPTPEQLPAVPEASVEEPSADDLLGLEILFKDPDLPPPGAAALSEADIERIVDRVIQKLSSQVIEGIAWEVVPDIAEKVLREELNRNS
jgi:hypothetical protein